MSNYKLNFSMNRDKISIFNVLDVDASVIAGIFLFLSSIKVTWFNYFIMDSHSIGTVAMKFLISFLLELIILSWIFKFKNPVPFIIFYIAQGIYIFSNMSYFGYFHNYLHLFQSQALFTEGVGSVEHFTIPVDYKDLIIFLDIPFFIIILRNYSEITYSNALSNLKRRIALCAFVITIIANDVFNFYYKHNSFAQIIKDYSLAEPTIVTRYGTIANDVCDVVLNYGGQNLIKHFKYGKEITYKSNAKVHNNVIAIQVESLDANIINKQYKNHYIAPFLHSLAQNNIYYPYVMSYHKSGGTSDAEFSTMNSVEPLGNFPSIKLNKYAYPNSVVRILKNNGYNTFAFHGNIGNYYNRNVAFKKMGFDKFYDINAMGFHDEGWGAPDGDVFNYAFNKLKSEYTKNNSKNFFSYIITMTSHTPFTSARNYYNNKLYDTIDDDRIKNYYNSVSYVDKCFEEFIGKIKATFKNTDIIIWGDHTPAVQGKIYKQASFIRNDHYFEFVPLIIVTPDGKKYEEEKEVGSFIDVAPTILYASQSSFSYKSNGSNLIQPPLNGSQITFFERSYDRTDLHERVPK